MCWGIDLPFKNKYDIKSLSQRFQNEIYQYVNISIAEFLRVPILMNIWTDASEDVFMKLRKINICS